MTNETTLLKAIKDGAIINPDFQPQNNKEAYLARLCGLKNAIPEPRTAEEVLLYKMCVDGINSSGKPEQEKTVEITENGTTEITADAGFALSKVTANVNVQSGGSNKLPALIDGSITEITAEDLEGVTEIRNYAFAGCSNVTNVTIPDNITSVGIYAFDNCTKLNHVTLGTGIDKIMECVFRSAKRLSSITIPENITAIRSGAFTTCQNLVEVINKSSLNLKKGDSSNGAVAYYALEIHDGESKIVNKDGYLFYTVDGINYLVNYIGADTELNLPVNYNGENYVIKKHAFVECGKHTSCTIPDSVTSIGDYAFDNCKIDNLTIGNGVTDIGVSAFKSCSLKNLIIGDNVETIGEDAFYKNSSLKTITLGSGVKSIGEGAFTEDDYIDEVYYNGNVKSWFNIEFVSVNSTPISSNDPIEKIYIKNANGDYELFPNDLVIPEEITNIGSFQMRGCVRITSLTIPDSVESIGEQTFYKSTGLSETLILRNITSIGKSAFQLSKGTTAIRIGDKITSIGTNALQITGLTDIYIDKPENSISGSPWGATNATIHWNTPLPTED